MKSVKIENIICYPVKIGSGNQLLVKIELTNGVYGWGASGLSTREQAVIGAINHYKEFLVGKDPLRIEAAWQEMYRSQYFEGGRVLTAAISAIDLALYDIKGKLLQVPVFELLGGKQREHVECFASLRFKSRDELFEKADILLKAGWKVLRLAPAEYECSEDGRTFEPRESIGHLSEWVTALRKKVGNSVVIGIDYHHRLSVPETASFIHKMPAGTLDFIEEPIRDESPQAYHSLRQLINVPFAIGEEFSSKWQFLPYIESNLTQFIRLDVCNVGGLTESKKVAAMAEAHYIDLMPHNPLGPICTAASIHLAASCTNFNWLEEINTQTEQMGTNDPRIYTQQPLLKKNRYEVPEMVGLGVEVNEALLLEEEFRFLEVPHLRRRDGSFTNW
ncbi:mandelate racemase/muconate lactonizing enzyme family protein [Echinicola strongylocentroti]|uniref:Mandelate racemase/muconate lactonizing enzyme family protein n=1 Tax=Echinicola strongylocentroti TaxID=1795355 RepID=A0A2Z4IQY7_9BACT|nr:mandelate racemase/muconate lactonizing enzyme family protein [Echinicola strongylocentroti]AWW33068.1 mandelate racemase/muconate lactonizing enzyme family protein [Echinicola strongylocentroti]